MEKPVHSSPHSDALLAMEVQSKVPQNQKMTQSIHCFNSIKSEAAVRSQICKRVFIRDRLATPNDHVSIPGGESQWGLWLRNDPSMADIDSTAL